MKNYFFGGGKVFFGWVTRGTCRESQNRPRDEKKEEGGGENKGGVRREIRSQPNSLSREFSEEKEKKKWGGGWQQRGETSRGVFLPSKSDKKVWSGGGEIGAKM